jgi:hypothetical protein
MSQPDLGLRKYRLQSYPDDVLVHVSAAGERPFIIPQDEAIFEEIIADHFLAAAITILEIIIKNHHHGQRSS